MSCSRTQHSAFCQSEKTVQILMKCILQHFIRVFNVCKRTHLGVSVYKGLNMLIVSLSDFFAILGRGPRAFQIGVD